LRKRREDKPRLKVQATQSQNDKTTRLERLPNITTSELNDKSKGDIFVKVIAVIQVFWVALQIIVRVRKGLKISQLELAVAAFSVCATITYLLPIPKPQNIRVPSRPIKLELEAVAAVDENNRVNLLRTLFIRIPEDDLSKNMKRIPNDAFYDGFDVDGSVMPSQKDYIAQAYLLGIMFGGIVFGSIHVAGWNLTFPTPTE
jgi:hypothetical protein